MSKNTEVGLSNEGLRLERNSPFTLVRLQVTPTQEQQSELAFHDWNRLSKSEWVTLKMTAKLDLMLRSACF